MQPIYFFLHACVGTFRIMTSLKRLFPRVQKVYLECQSKLTRNCFSYRSSIKRSENGERDQWLFASGMTKSDITNFDRSSHGTAWNSRLITSQSAYKESTFKSQIARITEPRSDISILRLIPRLLAIAVHLYRVIGERSLKTEQKNNSILGSTRDKVGITDISHANRSLPRPIFATPINRHPESVAIKR